MSAQRVHSSPWWAILFFAVVMVGGAAAAEPRVVPGLGLQLMPIPAGTFTMGSPVSETGHSENEGATTVVTITRPFWLGRYEVTHGQWRAIMGTDLSGQAALMLADDNLYTLGGQPQTLRARLGVEKGTAPRTLIADDGDEVPMYFVSWQEAVVFCQRLTERERTAGRLPAGYEYRVPTEAEWEYACRAGTASATYGADLAIDAKGITPVLDAIAWYAGNSAAGLSAQETAARMHASGGGGPHRVGLKQPNAWGLFDMLGNVAEWCGDSYAEKLPGGSVRDPLGLEPGNRHLNRGGSWASSAKVVRAAYRNGTRGDYRLNHVGFRVALAPEVHP